MVRFAYCGKAYKFIGYFTGDMRYPLEIEENDECISVDDYNDDGYLSISFLRDGCIFELEFEYDDDYNVNYESPSGMIVWEGEDNGVIVDDMLGEDIDITMHNTRKSQHTRHKKITK